MREKFRAWIESLETFFLEVIFEERHDFKAGVDARHFVRRFQGFPGRSSKSAAGFTTSASFATKPSACRSSPSATSPSAARAKRRWWKNSRANCATPAATSPSSRAATVPNRRRCTSRLLNKILLREDQTPPRVVSDGKSLLLDSEMAGDEPYMLASNLKDVVVLVDKDRVKSGRYAIEKFGCDTLLLDDGFQYWRAARPPARRGAGGPPAAVRQRASAAARHAARAAVAPRARPAPFSSPRATARPRNCASASPSSIPTPPSSNASIIRFISRTFSPANATGWIFCKGARSRR